KQPSRANFWRLYSPGFALFHFVKGKEGTMINARPIPDLSSIAGQIQAKRALEIAACGGHSIALIGGPGNGKTLLAQALFGLLPPLLSEQAGSVLEGQEALAWIEEALEG